MRNVMYFPDLLILKVVADNSENGIGIPVTRIVDACNKWAFEHNITSNYAAEFTSNSQRDASIELMESIGLIEHVGRRKGYSATDLGRGLLKSLGDNWREWFLEAPIIDGEVNLTYSKQADAYRSGL